MKEKYITEIASPSTAQPWPMILDGCWADSVAVQALVWLCCCPPSPEPHDTLGTGTTPSSESWVKTQSSPGRMMLEIKKNYKGFLHCWRSYIPSAQVQKFGLLGQNAEPRQHLCRWAGQRLLINSCSPGLPTTACFAQGGILFVVCPVFCFLPSFPWSSREHP